MLQAHAPTHTHSHTHTHTQGAFQVKVMNGRYRVTCEAASELCRPQLQLNDDKLTINDTLRLHINHLKRHF